jgi:hypothetical protein
MHNGNRSEKGGGGLSGRVGVRNKEIKTSVFIWGPCELQSQAGYVEKVLFCAWGNGGGERQGRWWGRKGEAGAVAPPPSQEGQTSTHHGNDDNKSCRMSEYTTRIY